jgi:DNA-binding transcriptional LysR family regulator
MLNLTLIEAFNAVMKTGSTTRAAEVLGISQPAISRSLRRLEDVTKLKLFERNGPRLNPTSEAELLHREVLDCYVGLDRLRHAVAQIRSSGSGSLRLASSAALGMSFVPGAMRRFHDKRPGVCLTLEIANSATVRTLVASGAFDIGLCADEIDRSNVTIQHFLETPGVCVMRPDNPLSAHEVITPEMLHGVPMVALAPDDTARKQFDRAMAAVGAEPVVVAETQFSMSVCQMALEGMGVGLINALNYVCGPFDTRMLVARRLLPRITFRALLVLPPQHARSQLVSDLVAVLTEDCENIQQVCRQRFG